MDTRLAEILRPLVRFVADELLPAFAPVDDAITRAGETMADNAETYANGGGS